jgi:hypothetical protein
VKKQERQACLISSAEAKAAKAMAKADELRAKLAKAASTGVALTPSGRVKAATVLASATSNKKSKGTVGAPSLSAISAPVPQLSLQRMSNTVNKRVSVQSPCQFSLRSNLSSSDCSTNSSSNARVIEAGYNTTDDEGNTSYIVLPNHHGRQPEAHRGHRYGSPLSCNHTGLTPGGTSSTASAHLKKQSSSSDSPGTNEDSNSDGALMEMDSSDSNSNESGSLLLDLPLTPVRLTTLFNGDSTLHHLELIESNIIDGIWPENHDITLLTHFVDCHFNED